MDEDVDSTLAFLLRQVVDHVSCGAACIVLVNFGEDRNGTVGSCAIRLSTRNEIEELIREFKQKDRPTKAERGRPLIFGRSQSANGKNYFVIKIAVAAIDPFELLMSLYFDHPHEAPDDLCTKLATISKASVQALERFVMRRWFEQAGHDMEFVGLSRIFQELEEKIKRVARLQEHAPVLILGERGSGKESVARAIHYYSSRRQNPFIAINSAALQRDLYGAELFGYRKGAFTGAVENRLGKFRTASEGTLFLDEITEIPQDVCGGLLRVLDRGEVQSMGYDSNFKVNVRVLAATNKNIEEMVDHERFPADVYDRLNVLSITVPPLRERKDDIPLLMNYFFRKYCRLWELNADRKACLECRENGALECLQPETRAILQEYDWPGNIRELRNAILWLITESATGYAMNAEHLPPHILDSVRSKKVPSTSAHESLELTAAVHRHISRVLQLTHGNKSAAAKLLGIPLSTLVSKMKRLSIESFSRQTN
jgi:DNA-binding NtrC family response regulator